MTIQSGSDLGRAILEALGLDPSTARSVTIRCAAGEVATVTVERMVLDDDGAKIVASLERYDVVASES